MQTITRPVPLSRSTSGMAHDGDAGAEQRRRRGAADERGVALVVGMGQQGHAGRDQLRAGRVDQRAGAVGRPEADTVHRAGALAVLELGLRDRGLEVDVPERGRLQLVGLPSLQQPQERTLRDALCHRPDRRVGHRPVDGQAERPPQLFEGALVRLGQPQAQLDEVGA